MKYPLRGILDVLTHTIRTWDRHLGGDETLKCVLIYRTSAIKGRALYLKIIFWALELQQRAKQTDH